MATATVTVTETSKTIVENKEEKNEQTPNLRLRSPKQEKKIQWAEGTVDNEGMGKKSSKCCCIYKKPRMFGESSSEDDSNSEDEDKCKAPKDYHKRSKQKPEHEHDGCNACP